MRAFAHRGCPALGPENTLPAFRAAAERLPCVELDVRRCGTGELVVFHDETLDRLTTATGRVSETSLADLRSLRVGDSDATIPTLGAVFEALPASTCVNVELKASGLAADVAGLVADVPNEVILSSFDEATLREAGAVTTLPRASLVDGGQYRSLRAALWRWHVTGVLGYDWDDALRRATALGCAAIHPHYALCTADRVASAHDAGFEVNAWTVPTREAADRLREMGVDGVFVNDPAVVGRGEG